MSNGYRQKCWLCKKATNGNLCSWPKDLIKPKNCIVDKNGYIVDCPCFELDLDSLCYTDIFKIFNVTKNRMQYFRYYRNMSPKEIYLLLQKELEEKENVNTNCA